MLANADTVVTSDVANRLGRRSLIGMLVVAAALPASRAFALPASTDPTATIKRFNDALLASMKAGSKTDFSRRFNALEPAVDQAFDLPAVLSVSVGPDWAKLSVDQKNRLLDAFRRYTVANYAANFGSYAGQTFSVSPNPRDVGADRVVVQSQLTPASGTPTELDYVMKQGSAGWKVVDVLAAGSISRVAVQRSDFRHLLAHGGGDALLSSLQRKASDLSGGALA